MRAEILLISGKMGSGKSTLADEVKKRLEHRWRVQIFNFADVLYELQNKIIAVLKGYGIEHPTPEKDRELLQFLGTGWGRERFGPDVWVNVMKGKIKNNLPFTAQAFSMGADSEKPYLFIIPDCRFRNEFDAFPTALRVRLTCKDEIRRGRAHRWQENSTHPSETDLDSYAMQSMFDMLIATSSVGINGMTDLVIAQLDKNVWQQKRKVLVNGNEAAQL